MRCHHHGWQDRPPTAATGVRIQCTGGADDGTLTGVDDMKKNIGGLDLSLRFLIAIGIGLLWYRGVISGVVGIVLGVVAVAFVLTSLIRWCPFYSLLHLSTRRVQAGPAT
jgi:Inner membrane protein YgaP-like, transmembrane domain